MIRQTQSCRRGFTLVEILAVVVILGIAAALVVPQISQRNDIEAAAAARVLMSDMMYAQNRAISLQNMHYIDVDTATQTVRVLDSLSPESVITHPVDQDPFVTTFGPNGDSTYNGAVIHSVSFNSHSILGFDELGSPWAVNPATNAASELISGSVVVKSGDYTLTIDVEPYTGELTVSE